MSPKTTVKTKCPVCEKRYMVPASACGHRARCSSCHAVFRVPQQTQGHPTEEDIMRWLNEAHEESEVRIESHHEHEPAFENEPEHSSFHDEDRPPVKVELSDTQIRWRKTG